MYRVPKVFLISVLAGAALGLSACGSSDTSDDPSSPGHGMNSMSSSSASAPIPAETSGLAATGPHNPADVDFATAMITHHAQAIEMARIVLERTQTTQVKDLAERIEAAQTPEIAILSGWLSGWGAPVPATSMAMGSGKTMDGMMSDSDMKELAAASESTVDALFLTQMSEHHRGAIAMAREELASGSNPQAKELAQTIKKTQTAEVSEMKTLLASIN
jgi:uncharacterized protein (DUF305 family)